ncbi:MAG: hypothetical protein AB1346_06800, partial [Thermodesulfobacteriota bacterium]
LGSVGAVLVAGGRRAGAGGRIVHRVELDGKEVSTRAEREMADRPVCDAGELRVETTTSGELLGEALDGAIHLSGALRHDIANVLASLRANDVSAATSLYISCVESLGTFFQLAGAVFNGVRTGAFRLPETGGAASLPEPPAETTEILQRLLAAHKSEDWPRMGELLEREVSPNLEKWAAFFSAMRGKQAR